MPAEPSSPTVLVDAAGADDVGARELSAAESLTLLQALAAVPDPRKSRGPRHRLQPILILAVGAVLAGAQSWAAIAQWAAVATGPLVPCGRRPHASTFMRVLSAVDPDELSRVLGGWVTARRSRLTAHDDGCAAPAAQARPVVAFDGKTLRGARDPHGGQVKLAAVFAPGPGLVLAQATIAGGDELGSFAPVLDRLPDLREVVVTADALHCQRGHADYLHDRGGHYLFTVKGNQPRLRAALAGLPWAQAPGLIERGSGHGRAESRSIKVIDLDGAPEADLFPHAALAMKVVRRRRKGPTGRRSVETVYAVTSLSHTDADAGLLAGWLPGHWRIENSLHWVRDVTSVKTTRRSGPAMDRRTWPPCATPHSTS